MRLVVDTNVLFCFFWKDSATRRMLMTSGLELFSPEYALEELNRHSAELRRKAGLSERGFRELREELAGWVEFVPLEDYKGKLREAARVSPDGGDADFFALALLLDAALWSNDSLLRRQRRVVVVSTYELVEMPEFLGLL